MFWIILIIWIIVISNNKKKNKAQDKKFDQGSTYGPATQLPGNSQTKPVKTDAAPKKKTEWVKIILGALSIMGGIEEFTKVVSESSAATELSDIVMAIVLIIIGAVALYIGLRNMKSYNTCEGLINKKGNTSIDQIAQALQKPYDATVSIISAMLRKNYYPDAYIDYQNRTLVMTKNGQALQPIVPYTGEVCPFCHGPVEEDAIYCKHCGKQIKDDSVVKEAKVQEEKQKKQEEQTRHIRELDLLVIEIDEQEFTEKIVELKDLNTKIVQKTEEDPELAASFRKFINIYMPAIINAVKTYKSVRSADYSIDETIESRKDALDALDLGIDSSKKLIGQLYDADQLNVSVELEMLRRMMEADGLVQSKDEIKIKK